MDRNEDLFPAQTLFRSLNLTLCPISVMYGAGNTGRRFEMATPGDLSKKKVKENQDNVSYWTQDEVEKSSRGAVEEEHANEARPGATRCRWILQELTVCWFSILLGWNGETSRSWGTMQGATRLTARRSRSRKVAPAVRAARGRWRMGVRKEREEAWGDSRTRPR